VADVLDRLCAPADDPRPAPAAVIIAAHPDDEVVGAGGRLRRLRQSLLIVHITDGAPRDLRDALAAGCATRRAYAHARRRECEAALALAGISPQQCLQLGCVDQEASLHLVDLARALADRLGTVRPEVVITHPYEGGHPDHDATAFATHAAIRLLKEQGLAAPVLVEMASYHNGPAGIVVGEFLPCPPGADDGAHAPRVIPLAEPDRAFKRRLLARYVTQQETLRYFSVEVERFRLAPSYDFTRPPHEGQLFYECFPWGMSGRRFIALARQAQDALGISGPL
jgi:LmbE family N-acetylglucosaminyl deacetylase